MDWLIALGGWIVAFVVVWAMIAIEMDDWR